MKNTKKLLSLMLVVAMVFSLGMTAFAEEAPTTTEPTDTSMEDTFVILHTNDIHGAVETYAYVAALKADYEAKGAEVVVMDAGDYLQGTIYVNESMGEEAMRLMNAVGYGYSALGNHELDYGYENISTVLASATYRTLAAGVTYEGEAAFDEYTYFSTTNGVKIGLFGLATPETMTKAHPDKIKGLYFPAGDELVAAAEEQVTMLEAEGCDVIIALGHLGVDPASAPNRSTDVLAGVDGIDLFIDGHSHTVIDGMANDYETNGAVLVSTGSSGDNVGVVMIDAEGMITTELVEIGDESVSDEAVAAMTAELMAGVDAEFEKVFATTEVLLNGERDPGLRTMPTNLGSLIADAMVWAAEESGNPVDAAITNGGGIRATIEAGEVTMKDINTVLPFGNALTTKVVTGAELLEAIEAATQTTPAAIGAFPQMSGIVMTLDTTVPYENGEMYPDSTYYAPAMPGARVTITMVGDKEFSLDGTYTVATNDFLSAGGDTYGAFARGESFNTSIPLDLAVIDYVEQVLEGVITAEMYGEANDEMTIVTLQDSFSDIALDGWYYNAVAYSYDAELVMGMGDGTFGVDGQMTVAQYLTVLYRMYEVYGVEMDMSYETTGDNWMEAAQNMFDNEMTDEELMMPISREMMAYYGAMFMQEVATATEQTIAMDADRADMVFTDAADIDEMYKESVMMFYQYGGINGYEDGSFGPEKSLTRAEVSQVFYNMLEMVEFETAA